MGFLRKATLVGLGLIGVTIDKAEEIVDDLIKRGELEENQRSQAIKELMDKIEQNTKEVKTKIENYVKEAIEQIKVPSRTEFEELKTRIEELEKKLNIQQSETDSNN